MDTTNASDLKFRSALKDNSHNAGSEFDKSLAATPDLANHVSAPTPETNEDNK
jgi:hypothetical protein